MGGLINQHASPHVLTLLCPHPSMPVRGLLFDLGRTVALFAPLLAAGVSAVDAQSGANPGYSAFAPCDGGMECGHVMCVCSVKETRPPSP
jgi:hypothetical protein